MPGGESAPKGHGSAVCVAVGEGALVAEATTEGVEEAHDEAEAAGAAVPEVHADTEALLTSDAD